MTRTVITQVWYKKIHDDGDGGKKLYHEDAQIYPSNLC